MQSSLFEKSSLKEIFKGLLSIVQLSRFIFCCSFQATAFIFYQSFIRLSRTFCFFLFRPVNHFRVFLGDSLFRLSHSNCFVNNFFIFSNSFNFPNDSDCFHRLKQNSFSSRQLFRLRVSAWFVIIPYLLLFSRLFLSDLAIISSLSGIVNVFSIIYIIQKIFAIQTILTIILLLKKLDRGYYQITLQTITNHFADQLFKYTF